jgi:putative ABC transport system substrate-binding protein
MKGSIFALFVAVLLLALPASSMAQQGKASKTWRIGWLSTSSAQSGAPELKALSEGLREFGYVEGQNLKIEARWVPADPTRLAASARELVDLNLDVICTSATPATLAAKRATSKIPIVFGRAVFPDKTGIVTSLAHPGGNVTGVTFIGPEYGKRLELLQEIVPQTSRVALLYNDQNKGSLLAVEEIQEWSRALHVTVDAFAVHDHAGLETAFGAIAVARPDALMTTADPFLAAYETPIVEFANIRHLVSMYGDRSYVLAGGLLFYGTSWTDMWRHAAISVDRILKGAKPGELPVEQPTKFELLINMKTAKALGLKIPQAVLLRADELIE